MCVGARVCLFSRTQKYVTLSINDARVCCTTRHHQGGDIYPIRVEVYFDGFSFDVYGFFMNT